MTLHCSGAESLGRRILVVLTADAIIDEVLEPIAAPRNRAAGRRDEAQRVLRFLHEAEPTFMQQPMVIVAEQR